jgi:hypothetical protein
MNNQPGGPRTVLPRTALLFCINSTIAGYSDTGRGLLVSFYAGLAKGRPTDDAVRMLASRLEAFFEEFLEMSESRRIQAPHDLNIVLYRRVREWHERRSAISRFEVVGSTYHSQLERSGLEPHITSRRITEHETKVDVYQVTIPIDQDVSVVSILDLQQERDYAVSSERLDEVPLSLGKSTRIWIPVCLKCGTAPSTLSVRSIKRAVI